MKRRPYSTLWKRAMLDLINVDIVDKSESLPSG